MNRRQRDLDEDEARLRLAARSWSDLVVILSNAIGSRLGVDEPPTLKTREGRALYELFVAPRLGRPMGSVDFDGLHPVVRRVWESRGQDPSSVEYGAAGPAVPEAYARVAQYGLHLLSDFASFAERVGLVIPETDAAVFDDADDRRRQGVDRYQTTSLRAMTDEQRECAPALSIDRVAAFGASADFDDFLEGLHTEEMRLVAEIVCGQAVSMYQVLQLRPCPEKYGFVERE
ncbi:hypothetical protein GF342_02615 [Candidatus Woesearchaeota archaeon]|nr:hypothetical protein [Candidatus Woesearchaeota archaeon]